MSRQKTTVLMIVAGILLISLLVPLMGCCSQQDPQSNNQGAGENTASNLAKMNEDNNKDDICSGGSSYTGSYSEQSLTTGSRYTGTLTIRACEGDVQYSAYFRGPSGTKRVARGRVGNRREFSNSYSVSSTGDYDKFCYAISGAATREECFP